MSLGSADDVLAMLQDAGDPCTVGDTSGYGILDETVQVVGTDGMEVQKRVTTLLVRTGAFDLYNGATVKARKPYATADTTYRLDEWQLQDDGAMTLLILSRGT